MKKLISVLLVLVMSVCLFVPALAVQAEAAGPKVLDFDVGSNFCAVVDQNNTLWMWGGNNNGQIGNGTDVDVYSPVAIMQDVIGVSCGNTFTLALKKDGTLWAWGSNTYGQLGNNGVYEKIKNPMLNLKEFYSTIPVKILDDVVAISAGTNHAAAIKKDHSLWMWGKATSLGEGFDGNATWDIGVVGDMRFQTIPIKVMEDVLFVSCGGSQTAVIKNDYSLWAWTNKVNPFIGNSPEKLMDNVLSVSCGSYQMAIIKNDNTLWMLGQSPNGELGNGVVSFDYFEPFMLMNNVAWASAGIGITAAIKVDGTLWLWGDNGEGLICKEANNGKNQDIPAQVDDKWGKVSINDLVCLAEKIDGNMYAWGSNRNGQIGTGDTSGNLGHTYWVENNDGSSYETVYYAVTTPSLVSIPIQGMSAWAGQEVSAAISAGLVPENLQQNYPYPVSRGNVAQMFVNLLEKSSGKTIEQIMTEKGVSINTKAFVDTTDKAVLACNALGIINGIGNNQFSPDGTFTRSQIAAIINRVARVMGAKIDGYTHSFTDVKGHWVDNELGWPVHAGIINGVGDNRFDPDGKLTTEQAIVIAYRALQVLKNG